MKYLCNRIVRILGFIVELGLNHVYTRLKIEGLVSSSINIISPVKRKRRRLTLIAACPIWTLLNITGRDMSTVCSDTFEGLWRVVVSGETIN